jgi:23S rRNA (adenine2503-C2)-methyltransferase
MIKELNDSAADAVELSRLLKSVKCNINLIEYNEHPGSDLLPSSQQAILDFQKLLADKGFETHTRFKRGVNIKAACGQLGLLGG